MLRVKPKTKRNSNYEAYQKFHRINQKYKNINNYDKYVISDAISVYENINETRVDYVINSLIKLCYNFGYYNTISSNSTIWSDIDSLSDFKQKNISFGTLLICCIKANDTNKSLQTLYWIQKYKYKVSINESFIVELIKLLNKSNELDYISYLLTQKLIPNATTIRTALISQYTIRKLNLNKAVEIFNQTNDDHKDAVMFATMMNGLLINNYYKHALNLYHNIDINKRDNICDSLAIKACTLLNDTKQVQLIENNILNDNNNSTKYNAQQLIPIQVALIDHYGNCHDTEKAVHIFDSVDEKDKNRIMINSLMLAFINNDCHQNALILYEKYSILESDSISHCLALKACANIGNFDSGKYIIQKHIDLYDYNNIDIQLKHELINFYGKCEEICNAQEIFDSIENKKRNSASINSMMTAFINNEQYQDALKLYDYTNNLNNDNIDNICHSLAIKACSNTGNFVKGKKIHSWLKKEDKLNNDIDIKTSLIDFYGKCHDIKTASDLFKSMKNYVDDKKITSSYNAMMNVYCINKRYQQCLRLFKVLENPDAVSYTIAFNSCSHDNKMDIGNAIYKQLQKSNNKQQIMSQLPLIISLIKMFGKFGDLQKCEKIFEVVRSQKDIYLNKISIWNVIIQSYGMNGDVINAIKLFNEMREKTNIMIDCRLYVTLLNACSHGGDVNQAKHIWFNQIIHDENMKCHNLIVSSFVDCLARNGYLYQGYDIIYQYEKIKDIQFCQEMWQSIKNGCKIYKNTLLIKHILQEMGKRFENIDSN